MPFTPRNILTSVVVFVFFSSIYGKNNPCNDIIESIYFSNSTHKSYFEQAHSFLDNDPQQTLFFLDKILETISDEPQMEILAYTFKSQAYNGLQKNELAFSHIYKAYTLATKEKEENYLFAIVTATYANLLYEAGIDDEAILMYKESNKVLNNVCVKGTILWFHNTNLLASIAIRQKQYDKANNYLNEALLEAKNHMKPLFISSAYNNLGLFYLDNLKNRSKALSYFTESKNKLDTLVTNHKLFYANINENIAKIYMDEKQYLKASNMLKEISKKRLFHKDFYSAYSSIIKRLQCEVELKRKKEVDDLVHRIKNSNLLSDSFFKTFFENDIKDYYIALLKYYTKKDFDQIFKEYTLYLEEKNANQKIKITEGIKSYLNFEKKSIEDNLQMKANLLEAENKESTLKIFFLIILTILLAAFFFILWLKFRLKKITLKSTVVQLEKEKKEKIKIDEKLDTAQQNINHFINKNEVRLLFYKNLISKIDTTLSNDIDSKKTLNNLKADIKAYANVENRLLSLGDQIVFSRKIIQMFPNLTKTEVELCLCIKLNLSIKEIAIIKKTSTNAINMSRSRLKKKITNKGDYSLDHYIQSI